MHFHGHVSRWAVAALVVLAVGCGGDSAGTGPSGPEPDPGSPPTTTFDAEFTPNTVYFDSASLGALQRTDTADFRYYFSAADPKAAALAPGQILLIHGLALRRVRSVTPQGGELVVETDRATLNEAIQNGTIGWEYDVGFGSAITPEVMLSRSGAPVAMRQTAPQDFELTMKIGEYDYEIALQFEGTRARVDMQIEKEIGGGVKGRFVTTGTIEQFHSSARIVYVNGQPQEVSAANDGLKGDLTLSLTVAGSGNDALNAFEFPVVLLKYPFLVGPIPVVLNVKVLFLINGVVPLDGSSQVAARFSYNSSTGIRYNGTSVESNATVGTFTVEKNETQTGASGPIGINYGLGFPRIELSMLGESIVPWAQTAFLIEGNFTPFFPPCQQARAAYIGAVGYNLSLLGIVDLAEGTKTLWDERQTLLEAGDCPDNALSARLAQSLSSSPGLFTSNSGR